MSEKEQEIKKILAGNVDFENDIIVAREGISLIGMQGFPNGWSSMLIAGLYSHEFWYDITENTENGFQEAANVLFCMGKRCKLTYIPGSEAIIKRGMSNSQLLVLEKSQYQLRLTIYSARTATAFLAAQITAKEFTKHLPKGIYAIEEK